MRHRVYRALARDFGQFAGQVVLLTGFSMGVIAMIGGLG